MRGDPGYRTRLLERRRELSESLEINAEAAETCEHCSGQLPRAHAAGLLSGLVEREQRELQEVDAALERLAEGTYGVCEQCRGLIEGSRLEWQPESRSCARCEAGQLAPGTP